MPYQLRDLQTDADIGSPGPLPSALAHLTDPELADLTWLDDPSEYKGKGFFPVEAAPVVRRLIAPLSFMQRIPADKRIAIVAAAAAPDFALQALLQMVSVAFNGVDLDDADTVAGLQYAQSKGLLTADEVAAIRA